jgi:uncharacterized protein (DUF952 family)
MEKEIAMRPIVHICRNNHWLEALGVQEYRAKSLDEEGFIHFSRPDQVLRVANAFYAGVGDLVLLWVDPGKLTAELRWEEVERDVFPHLYGPLNVDAVMTVTDLKPGPDGIFHILPLEPGDGINV